MNTKISYLLNSVRCMHRYHFVLASQSSATTRKHVLWIGRYRDPLEKVNYRILFLNVFRSLHVSSLRLLSQKTDAFSTDANLQLEKSTEISDSKQVPQSSMELEKLGDSESFKAKLDLGEPFFSSLQKCSCPSDVLDLASESAVSVKHFALCLTTVWKIFKKLSEDQQRYEKQLIFEHPAFAKICQHLLRNARSMMKSDLVLSLNAAVNLGISQKTLLVQTLLRVCQEKINILDNRCLSVLATTLSKMDEDKNVNALQSGLQLLVVQRIPRIRDIFILQNLMRCVGKDAPVFLKKKFEMAVLKEIDHLTFLNAVRVVLGLVAMNYRSIPILNACSIKIQENIHDVSFRQLLVILQSCYTLQYHNVKLFSDIADCINSAASLWDKRQMILFLSAFDTLTFYPGELMGIFAEKLIEDPEFLNLKTLLIVLRVYSQFSYVPRGQKDLFFQILESCLNKYLPEISNTNLLRAVYSLCILGHLPRCALDELLQKDMGTLTLSGEKEMMLHSVKACVELDSPSFTKPAFVLTENFSSVISLNLRETQKALTELLGDENMFRQNVQLPYKYHIDFEIRMDSDRKKVLPIAATDDYPDSSVKRLAFVFVPVSDFCLGTTHPRGKLALKMRHLNKLGYNVVLVLNKKFQEMTDEATIEVLKQKIYSENSSFSEATVQDN